MSYQVLARKWRPVNFNQIVGQSHVVRTLSTALELERIHHAYLFTGTRGVGKTTIARIMARCLNCETGVSADPCGTCSSCVEINEGRFVDLIEVDAASKTKIEDTRELLENVQYRPSRGKYKIYLIDEVHMLSKHSFNALLKTLEEPPPHVIFLLATTDPQMLPATVLSRCLQFHLKNMTTDEIYSHLQHILTTENINYDDKGVYAIAQSARGSMRDGLSLLDQSIAYGQGKVTADEVKEMLGTIDHDHIEQIIDLLISADISGILQLLDTMDQYAPNYPEVLDQIIIALHQLALAQEIPGLKNPQFDSEAMSRLAERIDAADIQMFYQIALVAKRDLYLAPSPRAGLEMCLLRMNSFRPATQEELMARGGSDSVKKSPSSSQETSQQLEPEPVSYEPQIDHESHVDSEQHYDPVLQNEAALSNQEQPQQPAKSDISKESVAEETATDSSIPDWSAESILRPKSSSPQAVTDQAPAIATPPAQAERVESTRMEQPSVSDAEDMPQPVEQTIAKPPEPQATDEPNETNISALQSITDITTSNWHQVVDALDASGISRQILLGTQVANTENNTLTLYAESRFWDMLSAEQNNQLSVQLHDFLDFEFTLKLEPQHPTAETPGQRKQRLIAEQLEAAKQHLIADPMVQALEKKFSASLDFESITPINSPETS